MAHGPSQQSMTSQTHYCGAEENEFLGAHNPECPHWHACGCSPKHSSLPVCHRCSCLDCARIRSEWAAELGWGRPRQLELFG